MNTTPLTDERIISAVCSHSLGGISAEQAAATLGITPEAFITILQSRPDLREESDRRVREDPSLAVKASVAGLNRAAALLVAKLDGNEPLVVSEIVQITDRLDRISAASKTSEMTAKGDHVAAERKQVGATYLKDTRPWPSGQNGFRLVALKENHPAMIDALTPRKDETEVQRKMRVDAWWATWFPVGPGNTLLDVGGLLQPGDRYFDGHRWHEA
jgi:hypothetical protein